MTVRTPSTRRMMRSLQKSSKSAKPVAPQKAPEKHVEASSPAPHLVPTQPLTDQEFAQTAPLISIELQPPVPHLMPVTPSAAPEQAPNLEAKHAHTPSFFSSFQQTLMNVAAPRPAIQQAFANNVAALAEELAGLALDFSSVLFTPDVKNELRAKAMHIEALLGDERLEALSGQFEEQAEEGCRPTPKPGVAQTHKDQIEHLAWLHYSLTKALSPQNTSTPSMTA